jgi:hypothetical protein
MTNSRHALQSFGCLSLVGVSASLSLTQASATDLSLSSSVSVCTETTTIGFRANTFVFQCGSQVFVADKDTSIIYECDTPNMTASYLQNHATQKISGARSPVANFSCRRYIVPPTLHRSDSITWPAATLTGAAFQGLHGGVLTPNAAQGTWNINQLNFQYCITLVGLPQGFNSSLVSCKTNKFSL